MIQIKNLNKRFGERVLFEDFSLTIRQGDFVIFNGESGSGKTTLLNMIGGIEPYDAGQILIDDLDVSRNSDTLKLFREKTGFLFQNFALVDTKTVEENINMVEKKYRNPETVSSVLAKAGLAGFEKRKIFTLSGGEQQRVAIARLFMKKCTIILADEPTGSLDQKNAELIINHIMELNSSGKTIIMVTHDMALKKIGDYTVEL